MTRARPDAGREGKSDMKRLADAATAPGPAGGTSDEEMRQVLRLRAARVARAPGPEPAPGERIEVVEFLLASERYAFEATCVRGVVPLRELTPVPCAPPFVMGVISVRGRIVSVIDIKKFFELPETGLGDLNKVIILDDGAMEFGVLADAIVGVRALPRDEIQPVLPTLTGIRAEYLLGLTADRLVVLDVRKILGDRGLVVLEEVEC